MEELVYDSGGQFLSGTFADYLCPTAKEVPNVLIGHIETRSTANRTGAKGMGDGSSMLTPAAIANAVADAMGREDVELPLTLSKLWRLANPDAVKTSSSQQVKIQPGELSGEGEVTVPKPPPEVWRYLTDPESLRRIIPGCRKLSMEGESRFHAEVELRVAAIKGIFTATMELRDPVPAESVRLVGTMAGDLGFGRGDGWVTLAPLQDGSTRVSYRYRARVGGKVASVGQRMLGKVTEVLIARFFDALNREGQGGVSLFARMRDWFRQFSNSERVR